MSSWIDSLLTEPHYNETIVLEIMQPVDVSIWVVRRYFQMKVESTMCVGQHRLDIVRKIEKCTE